MLSYLNSIFRSIFGTMNMAQSNKKNQLQLSSLNCDTTDSRVSSIFIPIENKDCANTKMLEGKRYTDRWITMVKQIKWVGEARVNWSLSV